MTGDRIENFKIMKGMDDLPLDCMFQVRNDKRNRLRGYHYTLAVPKGIPRHSATQFSARVVSTWKHLPKASIEAKSGSSFKKRIDNSPVQIGTILLL